MQKPGVEGFPFTFCFSLSKIFQLPGVGTGLLLQ
jgi:hypothetical protein